MPKQRTRDEAHWPRVARQDTRDLAETLQRSRMCLEFSRAVLALSQKQMERLPGIAAGIARRSEAEE